MWVRNLNSACCVTALNSFPSGAFISWRPNVRATAVLAWRFHTLQFHPWLFKAHTHAYYDCLEFEVWVLFIVLFDISSFFIFITSSLSTLCSDLNCGWILRKLDLKGPVFPPSPASVLPAITENLNIEVFFFLTSGELFSSFSC